MLYLCCACAVPVLCLCCACAVPVRYLCCGCAVAVLWLWPIHACMSSGLGVCAYMLVTGEIPIFDNDDRKLMKLIAEYGTGGRGSLVGEGGMVGGAPGGVVG